MELGATKPLLFQGTINAGGTLSAEIDLGDAVFGGLIFADHTATDGSVWTGVPSNGTLTFQVSKQADDGATICYADLYDDTGTIVAVTLPGARCGISALITSNIYGYRFVKIKSSVTQTNGVHFAIQGRP